MAALEGKADKRTHREGRFLDERGSGASNRFLTPRHPKAPYAGDHIAIWITFAICWTDRSKAFGNAGFLSYGLNY
jgi:hypothetical protein